MGLDHSHRPGETRQDIFLIQETQQELNVYGQPLQRCGGAKAVKDAGSSEFGRCTFRSYDAGAHQICVDDLPHGFSSKTGQGPWSNAHTGQPWCICIWAFSHWTNHLPENEAVPLRCSAVSSKVVDSQFATQHLGSCRAPPCDGLKSIRRLCQTCAKQVGVENASGRAYLAEKCRNMGVTEEELQQFAGLPEPKPVQQGRFTNQNASEENSVVRPRFMSKHARALRVY